MPEETTVVVEHGRFQDYIAHAEHSPHPTIVRLINERRFPFGDNTFFTYNPAKLGADEFNRCVELYIERGENGDVAEAMQLMQELMAEERPYAEELQELAIRVVREMYNVPDSLDLRAILAMPNPSEDLNMEEDREEPELPPVRNVDPPIAQEPESVDRLTDERKSELQQHIEKRRILNDIVHGAAVHQWTSAYYLAYDRLEELNPELCAKYNKLSALVNYWNWKMYFGDMDMAGATLQGCNSCDVKEKKIKAKAMNFPVLIHELSKGVLDYIASIGIPELPPHELKYIYAEADKYSHEQWHYFFGPTLWRAMLSASEVDSQQLPSILSGMAKMDYVDLSNFCVDITFHQEEVGKGLMNTLKRSCL